MQSGYYDETISRIQKGDPFGVYKDANPFSMFVHIAYNNINVAFYSVVFGVLFGIGTIFLMWTNGLMLRLFSIFIFFAGARLAIGIGYLDSWNYRNIIYCNCKLRRAYTWFWLAIPGHVYTKTIFLKSAKDAMKICVSLIPFFIIAAFFESYVTHLMSNTFQKDSHDIGLPVPVSVIILAGSFFFILWYFVLYPIRLHKKGIVLAEGKIIKNGIAYEL